MKKAKSLNLKKVTVLDFEDAPSVRGGTGVECPYITEAPCSCPSTDPDYCTASPTDQPTCAEACNPPDSI